MTTPAMASRAVVDAFQPQRVAVTGRIRSSLKTVMPVPLPVCPRNLPLVGAARADGILVPKECGMSAYRVRHSVGILSKTINLWPDT